MSASVHRGRSMGTDSVNLYRSMRGLWRVAGLPVLLLLVILEPLVTFVLAALSLFGLLTTVFFCLVGPPGFPAWTMLALSLGFAIALVPYHGLIRLLSNTQARVY
jgi:hypothetical protein